MAGKRQQGKHRLRRRPQHVIEMVDARHLEAHFLTDHAAVAGRRVGGRYVALCGAEVIPASLTATPETGCRSCRDALAQRGRTG
ncbi:MAG: hypothetical protein ACRDTJ_31810 [Pseudonocardiaceae bacterium]